MADFIKLKDLTPADSNTVNARFILLEKGEIIEEGKDKTKTCIALVADETASVNFQMWGAECEAFQPSDIIIIIKGIFSRHGNQLVLWTGEKVAVEKVGEFTMLFVESPNMSEMQFVSDASHPSKLVPGSEREETVKDLQKVILAEKSTEEAVVAASKDNKDEAANAAGEKEVEEDKGSGKDAQKKRDAESDERAKKSVSITGYLKPTKEERYYRFGRGPGGYSGYGGGGSRA